MFLNFMLNLLLAATSLASQHDHHHAAKRTDVSSTAPTTTQGLDPAKVSSQLQQLLGGMTISELVPSPTVTLGISIPQELKYEIMTAIPPDVIIKLMDQSYRASVASGFAAGSTPAWYRSLNPELKTFFEGMAKEIKTGSAVFTVTSTPTNAGSPDATGESVASSSSSAVAAAPTSVGREMAASIIALAGAAGVALVL
ncbi:hypothetical protein JX265_001938 [Neoarthrinium moseri]|uniref:Uncharacterized protein n=1 Tax=Neoarthrinium moseri TaxID=1658444 RepID=A0A9P9WW55_9PEZI|nr:hypothetical protein JX265_001938 [Neoarthrinium moseri]